MAQQSKYVAVKSAAIDRDQFHQWVLTRWPEAVVVSALHLPEGGVPHWHAVIQYPTTTRWGQLRTWLMAQDPHSYSDVARSWRASVRYLVHADNPEKHRVDAATVRVDGIDRDVVDQMMAAPQVDVMAAIRKYAHLGATDCVLACMADGIKPSAITGVLNAIRAVSGAPREVLASAEAEGAKGSPPPAGDGQRVPPERATINAMQDVQDVQDVEVELPDLGVAVSMGDWWDVG